MIFRPEIVEKSTNVFELNTSQKLNQEIQVNILFNEHQLSEANAHGRLMSDLNVSFEMAAFQRLMDIEARRPQLLDLPKRGSTRQSATVLVYTSSALPISPETQNANNMTES